MARKFQNLVRGTTTNNPLASGGTSLTSAELAALVAVASPEVLAITLDPESVNGDPEIIEVTAHTAAATSATITRAKESTVARAHPAGTDWVHSLTKQDSDSFAAGAPSPDVSNYFDRFTDSASPISCGTTYTDITALLDFQSNSGSPTWMPTWDTSGQDGPLFGTAGWYRMTYNLNAGGLATGLWSFRANYDGFEPASGFFWRQGAFSGAGNPLDLWMPDTIYIPAGGKITDFQFKASASVSVSYLELYISKIA